MFFRALALASGKNKCAICAAGGLSALGTTCNGKKSSGQETQFSDLRFAILKYLNKVRNRIKLLFLPVVVKRAVPKTFFIIEKDVINHESEETINDAILIINQLKGKTPYEIERICLTIKKLVHGNAKL